MGKLAEHDRRILQSSGSPLTYHSMNNWSTKMFYEGMRRLEPSKKELRAKRRRERDLEVIQDDSTDFLRAVCAGYIVRWNLDSYDLRELFSDSPIELRRDRITGRIVGYR